MMTKIIDWMTTPIYKECSPLFLIMPVTFGAMMVWAIVDPSILGN